MKERKTKHVSRVASKVSATHLKEVSFVIPGKMKHSRSPRTECCQLSSFSRRNARSPRKRRRWSGEYQSTAITIHLLRKTNRPVIHSRQRSETSSESHLVGNNRFLLRYDATRDPFRDPILSSDIQTLFNDHQSFLQRLGYSFQRFLYDKKKETVKEREKTESSSCLQ